LSQAQFLTALIRRHTATIRPHHLGWFVAAYIDRGGSKLFAAALAFPLGSGLVTLTLFVLSLSGIPLTRGVMLTVLGAGIVGLGLAHAYRWSRDKAQPPRGERRSEVGPRLWELPALLSIGLLFAASIVVSIARSTRPGMPPQSGCQGLGWLEARSGRRRSRCVWVVLSPNIPLQIAGFAILDNESVPGSNGLPPATGRWRLECWPTCATRARRWGRGPPRL
jgi:hypothetical protein